jgi:hypothetical protein
MTISHQRAKNIVRRFLDEHNLKYTKLTAKKWDFTDLARTQYLVVTVHGWQPDPLAGQLKTFGRSHGFGVSFSEG